MSILDKFHSDLIGKKVITPYGEAILTELDLENNRAICEHTVYSSKKLKDSEIESESIKTYTLDQITLKA